MSRVTTYGELKSIRSVVESWQDVKAEHLERWREIVIGHFESERKIWSPEKGGTHKDALTTFYEAVSKIGQWRDVEPPEFECHTGIVLSDQQRIEFNNGNSTKIVRMAKDFVKDAFGGLLHKAATYKKYTNPIRPAQTQFAALHWHRDPAPFVVFVASGLPMKILRGAMSPDFQQSRDRTSFAYVGKAGDVGVINKVDQWAKENARLIEMPTHEIVIDVGQSWHCPAINTGNAPMPRVFLRGVHSISSTCFKENLLG